MERNFIDYGGVEVEFSEDALFIRPHHFERSTGVIGIWGKSTIATFSNILKAGGCWVYRWQNEEEYSGGEYRMFADKIHCLLVWQGGEGDYFQAGSGPILSYFTPEQYDKLMVDVEKYLDKYPNEYANSVVWLV